MSYRRQGITETNYILESKKKILSGNKIWKQERCAESFEPDAEMWRPEFMAQIEGLCLELSSCFEEVADNGEI